MAGRQGREELIKKGLLEMMEQGKWDRHLAGALGPGMQTWASHMGPGSSSGPCGNQRSLVSRCSGWTQRRPPRLGKFSQSQDPWGQPSEPLRTHQWV